MNLLTLEGPALPSFCNSWIPALPLALDAPASASWGRHLCRCGHRRASTPDLKPQVWVNPRWATAGAQWARKDGAVTLLLPRQVQGPGVGGRVFSGSGHPELLGLLTMSLILPTRHSGTSVLGQWGSSMSASLPSRSSSRYCPVNTSHDDLSYHYLVFPSLSQPSSESKTWQSY